MPSDTRGSATNVLSSTPITVTSVPPPTKNSYILVAVGFNVSTIAVTGITAGTGTFVKATNLSSANRSIELWVGYNFGTSQPTSVVVSRGAGTTWVDVMCRTIDVLADCTVAPSFTASSGNTGTSTSADSNTLTPAVGDIMMAGAVWASTSASSARTHTGNTYRDNLYAGGVATTSAEMGWCEAYTAASSKEVWTIPSVEWASIQVMWTPAAAPAATAALVVKGLDTAAADAASSF